MDAMKGTDAGLLVPCPRAHFNFVARQAPVAQSKGHIPHMECPQADQEDNRRHPNSKVPYSETVPERRPRVSPKPTERRQACRGDPKVIQARLNKAQKERPIGYLVRHAPADDVKNSTTRRAPGRGGHHEVPQDLRP